MVIERKVGDHGPSAAVLATVTDADGQPVTAGPVTLRVAAPVTGPYDSDGTHLLDAAMTHDGQGVWRWEPEEDDLIAGRWRVEVVAGDAVMPAGEHDTLLVRPRLPGEE